MADINTEISEKADDFGFSDEQNAAIGYDHLSPAIVTAAAGSGKTTLLVGRIVRLISDMKLNIPADSLVVLTFTRNATKNMRKKLNDAMNKELERLLNSSKEQERYDYLKKQQFLLRHAAISTIDSFCLKIIKENVEAFDLPLNFTIADGAKKVSMQSQAIKATLQDFYGSDFTDEERDALFFSFNFENDNELEKAIMKVSDKLESFPDIEGWIEKAKSVYNDIGTAEKEFLPLLDDYFELKVGQAVKYAERYTTEDIVSCLEDEITEKLAPLEEKESSGKKLTQANAKDLPQLREAYNDVLPIIKDYIEFDKKRVSELRRDYEVYKKSPSIANLSVLMANLETSVENQPPYNFNNNGKRFAHRSLFNSIRNSVSDKVNDILKFKVSEEFETSNIAAIRNNLNCFFRLLRIYINYYDLEKRTSGCIDFSDCEREVYNKLRENDGDNEFRAQLSKRFSCIIVDEFQDSNDLQAEIFRLLGDNERLFYVGDVKQSIYSFRGADPFIMADLCKEGSGFKTLPLNKNFRSRIAVINTVNAAFNGLMTAKYGGVDYSKGHELRHGSDLPEPDNKELYNSEIHLLKGIKQAESENDEDDRDMTMPRYVAKRIQELHDDEGFLISDGKDEKKNFIYRRAEYSDFIILLRKKKKIDCYRKALSEIGISSTAPKASNLFETDEVLLVCNYLKIIDNPRLNEEMLKVLMSPIYRFTAEEVAQIKMGILGLEGLSEKQLKQIAKAYKRRSFYTCITDCMEQKAKCGKDVLKVKRNISSKLERFINDLKSFRYFMNSNSPDALISKVYEDTELIAVVSAFEDSAGRVENIRRLQKIASDYEARSGGSLGDLLRYIDRARENASSGVEEAARPEIAANSVRIMTYHGSKGLEAPVCIMSELHKKLNGKDYTANLLISFEHFMAMKSTAVKNRRITKPLAHHAIGRFLRERLIGDELRLLYVAMTRAREKLIMVSTINNDEKDIRKYVNAERVDPDLHDEVYEESVPFKYVLKTLLQYAEDIDDESDTIDLGDTDCKISVVNVAKDSSSEAESESTDDDSKEEDEGSEEDNEPVTLEDNAVSEEEVARLTALIKQKYAHLPDTEQQAKFTATELAHNKSAKPVSLTKPVFARDNKITGVEKGNAYHHCMQHIPLDCVKPDNDLEDATKIVETALDRLVAEKKITEDERSIVEPFRVAKFFTNELGRRMSAAYTKDPQNVKREQSFYAEVNGKDVRQDYDGNISIQGQIDMYFVENGEIVVVDYKSDTLENLSKEINSYKFQVEIYMKILKKLTGINVKEMYLYAFLADRELKIE